MFLNYAQSIHGSARRGLGTMRAAQLSTSQEERDRISNKRRYHARRGKETMEKIYATVSDDKDCLTFREIADRRTAEGDVMNHATARNHVLRAMRKFAQVLGQRQGRVMSEFEIEAQATDPEFQSAVGLLLQDYFTSGGHLIADI
jgi:hypothetical protein